MPQDAPPAFPSSLPKYPCDRSTRATLATGSSRSGPVCQAKALAAVKSGAGCGGGANRSSASALFREQLEDLKNLYLQRLNLVFVFSREQQDIDLYNGRITQDKCQQLFSRWLDVQKLDAAFICGPQAMTETVRDSLKAAGMGAERIHFELFHAAGDSQKRQAREAARAQDPQVSQITVISDGRALAFDLPRNSLSLLDAGNAQGAELPYSCKAGVCSTCKCKVVEGEVEMDSNHALEDYEVAAGYVLACQSFPVSDKVVLDFDQL